MIVEHFIAQGPVYIKDTKQVGAELLASLHMFQSQQPTFDTKRYLDTHYRIDLTNLVEFNFFSLFKNWTMVSLNLCCYSPEGVSNIWEMVGHSNCEEIRKPTGSHFIYTIYSSFKLKEVLNDEEKKASEEIAFNVYCACNEVYSK
jgi:hypothetical protein